MKTSKNTNKALNIVGIVLCVILIPILIINCTLIVKNWINDDEVPSIGGVMPLIVLTDSMYPDIKSGDIIICKEVAASSIVVGDYISFFDPAGNGSSITTHRVEEIIEENGQRSFRTRGIANNTDDRLLVSETKLVGKYTGLRIAYAGNIALFMQTVPGLIVCVVVPIVLLVGYDMIRRKKYEKSHGNDMDRLLAELEELKAANAKKQESEAEQAVEAPQEQPVQPEQPVQQEQDATSED